jgi:hypothetical protein
MCLAQLKGMEEYIVVADLSYDNEKQYSTSEGDYDYQVQDAVDNHVSMRLFNSVWKELNRVMQTNGVTDADASVLVGPRKFDLTQAGIRDVLLKGCNHIKIRYDLKNGYFAYLNLQDEFCGLAISKDKVE